MISTIKNIKISANVCVCACAHVLVFVCVRVLVCVCTICKFIYDVTIYKFIYESGTAWAIVTLCTQVLKKRLDVELYWRLGIQTRRELWGGGAYGWPGLGARVANNQKTLAENIPHAAYHPPAAHYVKYERILFLNGESVNGITANWGGSAVRGNMRGMSQQNWVRRSLTNTEKFKISEK